MDKTISKKIGIKENSRCYFQNSPENIFKPFIKKVKDDR